MLTVSTAIVVALLSAIVSHVFDIDFDHAFFYIYLIASWGFLIFSAIFLKVTKNHLKENFRNKYYDYLQSTMNIANELLIGIIAFAIINTDLDGIKAMNLYILIRCLGSSLHAEVNRDYHN